LGKKDYEEETTDLRKTDSYRPEKIFGNYDDNNEKEIWTIGQRSRTDIKINIEKQQ